MASHSRLVAALPNEDHLAVEGQSEPPHNCYSIIIVIIFFIITKERMQHLIIRYYILASRIIGEAVCL